MLTFRSVGSKSRQELTDVATLVKENGTICHFIAIDTQKIRHGTLVDNVPIISELRHKLSVE